MGAEASILQELDFDEDPVLLSESAGSGRPSGARLKDGKRVSVFLYEKGSKEPDLHDNAAKQLKILRHPGILRFLNWKRSGSGRLLVTEYVQPLESVLEQLSGQEICAGLYNIVEALVFLHDRGGLCHNNVCLSSIFVAEDGSWKLGGLQYLCRFEQATVNFLETHRSCRNQMALAPEEKTGSMVGDTQFGHVRDVYAFGILAEALMEYLQELGDKIKTFEIRIQDECLNLEPKSRLKMNSLLQDRLFQDEYLEILNFLRNITLKEEEEKKVFFETVASKLHNLPVEVVARRLVNPLTSRFVLLESSATEHLLPHLLTPCRASKRPDFSAEVISPLLPEELFKTYIIPQLFKIFHVRDAHIRLILLQHFHAYIHLFDTRMLRTVILPQVRLGIRDNNDELVTASLRALAEMVPYLGGDTVVGAQRMKLFTEGTPKFSLHGKASAFQVKKKSYLHNGVSSSSNKEVSDMDSEMNAKNVHRKSNKPTLMELAKDADRNQRRDEARKRQEERRTAREALQKNKALDEDAMRKYSKTLSEVDNKTESKTLHPADDPDLQHSSEDSDRGSSDYEGEIEKELNTMNSTLSTEQRDRVSCSPHTITIANNPLSHKSGKGALKLKAPKSKLSPPPTEASDLWNETEDGFVGGTTDTQSVDINEGFDDWGSSWGDGSAPVVKHSSAATSSKSPASTHSNSPARHSTTQKLGSEFDIMSIDVKKKEEGLFDFFAGMEPAISKQTSLLDTLAGPSPTAVSNSLSYNVADSGNFDDGWGDDDWGDPDDT